jgi:hypothetical protein
MDVLGLAISAADFSRFQLSRIGRRRHILIREQTNRQSESTPPPPRELKVGQYYILGKKEVFLNLHRPYSLDPQACVAQTGFCNTPDQVHVCPIGTCVSFQTV